MAATVRPEYARSFGNHSATVMKLHLLLALIAADFSTGCSHRGVHITKGSPALPIVAESGPIHRDKPGTRTPRVVIENAQMFDNAMFSDLRKNFLIPIEAGPYRYTIDSIMLEADADAPGEWALVVLLDTGAQVRLDDFVDRDEQSETDFSHGYRRLMSALDRVRSRDGALDRYVRRWKR